jgi:hypothetical protein
MRRLFTTAALATVAAVLAATGTSLVACNGVLGIDPARLEDAGSDAGSQPDASVFVARDDCDAYCGDMAQTCSGLANQEYLSNDVCQKLCDFHTKHYDEQGLGGPVDVSPTTLTAMGDTIYCRVWHAHAAIGGPEEHCPHAGPLGAGVCGTNPCDDFCSAALEFCGDKAYASMGDCLQACNADAGYPGFPYLIGGDASDLQSSGNTLNCRIYHLQNFLFMHDPIHCTHVAADGGGVCGN